VSEATSLNAVFEMEANCSPTFLTSLQEVSFQEAGFSILYPY